MDVGFDNPAFDPDAADVNDADDVNDNDDFDDADPPGAAGGVDDSTDAGTRNGTDAPRGTEELRREAIRTAVDDFYKNLPQGLGDPELGINYDNFEVGPDGKLRLKNSPVRIVNAGTGKPLAFSTVARELGGAAAIKNELGFTAWRRGAKGLSPEGAAQVLSGENSIASAQEQIDSIELDTLNPSQGASEISSIVDAAAQVVETTLSNPEVSPAFEGSSFTLRELRGLDKAMQGMRGELTNNLAKVSELQKEIAGKEKDLADAPNDQDKQRISKALGNLRSELEARLEAASENQKALRSQISRIRETFRRILEKDTTLSERIKTLFREQGITIASILTAVGMAISTIVLAVIGPSATTGATPPGPGKKGGAVEWIKNKLKALGSLLARLAGKAASALPGILGSVVSWLLGLLGKTATWLAQNTWAVVVALAGLLYLLARRYLERRIHAPSSGREPGKGKD